MTTYVVSFERIGRNHEVPELTVTASSPDDLADRIHKYAKRYLASAYFDVDVLSDDGGQTGKVSIELGRFGGGTFRVTK